MRLRRLALATAATCTTAYALERNPNVVDPSTTIGKGASSVIALVRFTRALTAAVHVMTDYRSLFNRHQDYSSDSYRNDRSAVHQRNAQRMLDLAKTQGAVYVKIGQHIASMNHAVPPEYSTKLKLLEDRAAYRPFWQIERVVSRELGCGLNDVFDDFQDIPVAAASLAQVHRAKLKTGENVAVKVQYPGLESLVSSDLTSIQMLSWLMSWVFPFFDMQWVVGQFRKNLSTELDFNLEAQSARRTGVFFENHPRVKVPFIYSKHSTTRLLTMEFVDGFRVDDVERLKKAGVDASDVAQTVVDAFAQMIFMNGFVHCDPHAGNLMVRPLSNGKFDLFLLDHGLYRQLDEDFRKSYCQLWKGLVLRRTSDVEQACQQLGAAGFANVFSIFLLNRSWRAAKSLGTDIRMKMSKDELKQLREDVKESGLRSQMDISHFVENIPDDLLLVFKMNSLVRNVNKALGASVNRFKVNARYAVRGLRHVNKRGNDIDACADGAVVVAGTHCENGGSWTDGVWELSNWFATLVDCISVEFQLLAIDTALFAVKWWYGKLSFANEGKGSTEGLLLIG